MAKGTITNKVLDQHMASEKIDDKEIALFPDQTLTQDATGTLVMLELEAMGLKTAKTQLSVQYVDHNIIQNDFRNPDDHLFLQSICKKLGIVYSPPGNGISHPLHMTKFLSPGQLLVGSDSHTCASGGIGAIAFGMGGMDIARAIAGFPVYIKRPKIMGIHLYGQLPDWVSAKDLALFMLKIFGVRGLKNHILEYVGEGVSQFSVMDRHVIANMAVETGATCAIFPSDDITKKFMKQNNRVLQWSELQPDKDCVYDVNFEINLSNLVPLIAKPSSPGNVVEVAEVKGEPIYQSYIGSSANPGFRDFAICAEMLSQQSIMPGISFDINPSSREILENLISSGHLMKLLAAGARLHQAGCNGCIGMGQAPASEQNSLRTTPRNFKGRSGTSEDKVWLCSPETATASAIKGVITDPRDLNMDYPRVKEPEDWIINERMFIYPIIDEIVQSQINVIKGPNIKTLPKIARPREIIECNVILKLPDDISTDEILPAGDKVLPFRSNLEELSKFTFEYVGKGYYEATRQKQFAEGHIVVAGNNYGQGSSREHAALAPRYLGLQAVIAKGYARIHRQNLINFAVVPFEFVNPEDYEKIEVNQKILIENIYQLLHGDETKLVAQIGDFEIPVICELNHRQKDILLHGGLLNYSHNQLKQTSDD